MSFGAGTLLANVNDQTVLHKLAIEGGTFAKTQDADSTPPTSYSHSAKSGECLPMAPRDDPTLITFILKELSSYALQDSLCTLKSTADIFGRRPLHYAAMHGFPNITRALINDLKASGEFVDFSNPYWFDTDGFTPLIYAVSRGQAAVLQILIEEGGIKDVDAVTNGNRSFQHCIFCLTTQQCGDDINRPVLQLVYGTHPSMPKVMPATPKTVHNPLVGSEVNLHAAYTYTPLSIACRLGHVEAARLLIKYGACLDAQDEEGESCLIIASKNGHVECVKLLIEGPQPGAGANLELRERYYGWTALHLAGMERNSVSEKSYPMDVVNRSSKFGCIASYLTLAIENHPEVVKVLLAAGANPNVYDYSGWNPHEHAVFAANNVCATLLRLVSRNLDERQRLQKLTANAESGQVSPTKAAFSTSQPLLQSASGSGTNGLSNAQPIQRAESPPVSGKNSVKVAKTVHRAYGHKYLENESLIVVTLGSNDIRSTVEPVELFNTGDANSFLTASTAFSLEITAENATAGEKVIIDLPLKDSSYHEQIDFYAANPEETILTFSVYPTFGHSSDKLVGRGTAMLSSLDNLRKDVRGQHPEMTSLQGMNMTVPIFGVDSMTIIGRVRVEFTVVRPFKHENLKVGSKHTYWKSLTTTVCARTRMTLLRATLPLFDATSTASLPSLLTAVTFVLRSLVTEALV